MAIDPAKAEQYNKNMHAVQSGIAMLIEAGDSFATPKHLRVGINSAMVNDKAVATLLIEKGIFTEDEYMDAVLRASEDEVQLMTDTLEQRLGVKVNLI